MITVYNNKYNNESCRIKATHVLRHFPDGLVRVRVSKRLAERPVDGERLCPLGPANQKQRQEEEHEGSWTQEGGEAGDALHLSGGQLNLLILLARGESFHLQNEKKSKWERSWEDSEDLLRLCVPSPVGRCWSEDDSVPRLFIHINPPPPL